MNIVHSIVAEIARCVGVIGRSWTLDPFTQVVSFLTIGASATSTATFNVQSGNAFAICSTSYAVSDSSDVYVANISAPPRYAPFLVTLQDDGSGRQFSDAAVHIDNIFGTAERPYKWPVKKVLTPNTTFSVTVQNLVATAYNLRLAFHGYKIFQDIKSYLAYHTEHSIGMD